MPQGWDFLAQRTVERQRVLTLEKTMATSSQRFCPGPPGPLTALRTGGKHGVYLAANQQAGCSAPAALPGLAHCDHSHHLPPMEGQLVSSVPALAIQGEQLRHQDAEGGRTARIWSGCGARDT